MRIAYITAHAPYGRGEAFVLEEMLEMVELGVDLDIIPRNPPREVFHSKARKLLNKTIWLPLLDGRIFFQFIHMLFQYPFLWRLLGVVFLHSRSVKVLIKNLAVIPKAVLVARLLKQREVVHIHAHWGSTTSTMAWAISEITGIPWSLTLHRWDIVENNMLKLKVKRANFARCISQNGRDDLLQIIGEEYSNKVKVLHMGVRVPEQLPNASQKRRPEFVIACPANLVPVKGHRFLIEASKLLSDEGISHFRWLIIGDGPLKKTISEQIAQYRLDGSICLMGHLPHEALIKMYENGEVDAVVLPSIITDEGEKEGIPVVLMEAMAYAIPVVSTKTGGIPELLRNGAGILVPERSADALAQAILRLREDEDMREKMGRKGRERVEIDFNLEKNVRLLLSYIKFRGKGCNEHLDF